MQLAWHFVGERLRDGRLIPSDGEWLTHGGNIVLCQSGLHASLDPWDALRYAPGETLCLVECDGNVMYSDDKLVCARRRIVRRLDATEVLRYFARIQAASVLHLWDAPDVVIDYLMTGDESTWDAAWDAASDAAWSAASAAASDAAWSAARASRAAAWAASSDAASAAASADSRDAAWSAAWDAARAAARADWRALVAEAFGLQTSVFEQVPHA